MYPYIILITYTIDAYIGKRTSHLHCSLRINVAAAHYHQNNFGIVFLWFIRGMLLNVGKKNTMNDIDKIANIDKIIWQVHIQRIF